MSSSADPARRPTLLPAGASALLRRIAGQALGVLIIAAAGLLAVALIGYDPADPGWSHATDRAPTNPLGESGAFAADILLHSFGLAIGLATLALAGWGWRLLRYARLDGFWLRLIILPVIMLTGATVLHAIDGFVAAPTGSGAGGMVGALLAGYLQAAMAAMAMPPWPGLAVVTAITLALLPIAIGVPRRDWRAAAAGLWAGAAAIARIVAWLVINSARAVAALRRRDSGDDADSDILPADPARKNKRKRRRKSALHRTEPSVDKSDLVSGPEPAKPGKRAAAERQGELALDQSQSVPLPPLHLLREAEAASSHTVLDKDALSQNARMLETVLEDFGVQGSIGPARQGPVVTRYDLEPAPGTRSSRVINLADDIARSMSAVSARVAVVPGRNAIGIELPNPSRETVSLRELLASRDYERSRTQLPLVLGKDIAGAPVIADLAKMPHLLVAGTTGSGKSVGINSMILSLLYRLSPDQCRLILIDPKMLELSIYDGIPHLLHPVVTEPAKAVMALKWAVKEMNHRYQLMAHHNVRNIAGYNHRISRALAAGKILTRTVGVGFDPETKQRIEEEQPLPMETLPFLVVVVDEMADLMLVAGKEIEMAVQNLAQKARAAGIHLIIATQRPSVDVITGTIKANLPTRISFQVTSKIDSRTILGDAGAEQLLGMGDMLYMAGGGQVNRIHGAFVSEEEVEEVAKFLASHGEPDYLDAVTAEIEDTGDGDGATGSTGSDVDELYDQAVDLISRERRASTSFIQRHFQIGYNRAARIIEQMEADGIVTPANRTGKREVLTRAPDQDGAG